MGLKYRIAKEEQKTRTVFCT